MQHIAADRHGEPFQAALAAADGQRVQQRLGRVLMRAVPGVDHGRVNFLRQQIRRAGLVVTDHQQVAMHGVQGGRGVQQGFPLIHRGGGDGHVQHVRAEPLAGEFEAGAGARRILEEQIDQGASAQQIALGLAGAVKQHIALRQIEHVPDFRWFETLDREQMFLTVGHGPRSQDSGGGVNRPGRYV